MRRDASPERALVCTRAHIPRSRASTAHLAIRGTGDGRAAPQLPPTHPGVMTNFAFVFPGQGSQSVGMGRALAAASPGRRGRLRRPPTRPSASPSRRSPGRAPRSSSTGPRTPSRRSSRRRSPTSPPPTSGRAARGHDAAEPALLRRPLDGPVLGDGRVERADARPTASASSASAGVQMQASGAGRDGAMAAILGLDDAAIPELVERASAHGVFAVANRNSPGQVVVSGERAAIEAAAEHREGARRQARHRPARVRRGPLAAHGRGRGRRCAQVLADVEFREPDRRRCSPTPTPARSSTATAARAELVEHLTAGVDWVRAVETMAAAGVDTFIEVGPGKVLTNLDQADRARRDRHRPRRRPRRRRTSTCRSSSPSDPATSPDQGASPVRSPDHTRRVVVTGLGVVSPVGNDKDDRLVQPRRGPLRPGRADPLRRLAATSTRPAARSSDFDADRVDGPEGRPPQRARDALRRRRREAGRRRLRASRSTTRTGPRSGSSSAPGAGGQQLMIDNFTTLDREGPEPRPADVHRQRPRRLDVGDDRDRDRRDRPQHRDRLGVLDRHPQRRRGRRGDPPRRLHRGHQRLDRGAAPRGRPRRLHEHARHGLAAAGRAAPDRLAPVRRDAQRLRPRRGRGLAVPRGPRAREGARREDLRRGRRLRLGGGRLGHDPADRGRDRLGAGDEDGPRPPRRPGRRGRPHQPPRHVDAGRRRPRGRGDLGGLRRPLGAATGARSRSPARSR